MSISVAEADRLLKELMMKPESRIVPPVQHPAEPERFDVTIAHATLRGTITGVLKRVFGGLMKARSTVVELHIVRNPRTFTTEAQGVLRLAVPFGLEVTDEALRDPHFGDHIEQEALKLAEGIIREIRRELAAGEDELAGVRPGDYRQHVLGEFELKPKLPEETPAEAIPPMPFEPQAEKER